MQVSESRVKFTGTMTSRSLSTSPYREGQFVICLTPYPALHRTPMVRFCPFYTLFCTLLLDICNK